MANLRDYMYKGIKDGMDVNFYVNKVIKIGGGTVITAMPLQFKLTGEITHGGQTLSGDIAVTMPDESLTGSCTLTVGEDSYENCAYKVVDERLEFYPSIKGAAVTVTMYGQDREWTWFQAPTEEGTQWIGVWPA